MSVSFDLVQSPIGELLLLARNAELAALYLEGQKGRPAIDESWRHVPAHFDESRRQLEEYFAGRRRRFDLPLAPQGSSFQLRVWHELQAIPFGETRSYGEVATRLGQPKASRAVGAANARNPLSIVVPCHRVIGTRGALVGYAGGSERKRWLLELEASAS